MDQALKQRLVGAVVLIALAVIFLPVFISGPQDDQNDDPAPQILVPPAPESRLSSKRLPVIEDGSSRSRDATGDDPQWPIALDSTSAGADRSNADALAEPTAAEGEEQRLSADNIANDDNTAAAGEDWLQDTPRAADADVSEAANTIAAGTNQAAAAKPPVSDKVAAAAVSSDTAGTAVQLSAAGPDASQWHVQVASLGNPDNVRRLQQQLQGMSMQTITERIQRDDNALYRVLTGPYAEQSAAAQALQRIRSADARLRPVLLEPEGITPVPTTAATTAVADTAAAIPTGLDRYAVQVGVFSARERGEEVVAKLQNAGFAAYQEGIERSGETLYRVRIGPLLSEQDGNNIAARIKRDLNLDSLVVDYR